MAGPRQPINLVLAKGKKHLTKEEIETRQETEPQPCEDNISAPPFLTAVQKRRFNELAKQLQKIKIMGETDCEALARYIVAECEYEEAVKQMAKIKKHEPAENLLPDEYWDLYQKWQDALTGADKRIDRYFKQAHTAASALGLTISSRCKLQVPVAEKEPKANKFAKFGTLEAVGGE